MGSAMPILITVNTTFWDSLPEDLRTLMMEVGQEAVARNADLIRSRREEAKAGFEAAGVTFHEMPFDEKVKWSNALSDIPGTWIEEMEGKGRAGKAVMVQYLDALESMGHQFPRQVGGGLSLTERRMGSCRIPLGSTGGWAGWLLPPTQCRRPSCWC